MKLVRKRSLFAMPLAVFMGLAVAMACAQIAGIEDRDVAGPSRMCEEYCGIVLNDCPTLYYDESTCLATCELLPQSDAPEPPPNSVNCRLRQAKRAGQAGQDRDSFCHSASAGGNGTCGTNCESYCLLYEATCGETPPDCEKKCEAFGDSGGYDVANGADHEGNTVQCRLVHTTSATVDPETHCRHADFLPNQHCYDLEEVSCDRYCRMVNVACQGEQRVYESREQCMASCGALEPGLLRAGNTDDQTADTIACRTWHAMVALSDDLSPRVHCPHAGPTGDGHCGLDDPEAGQFANCRPYCRLLADACGSQFSETWDSHAACVEECDASEESFGAAADQLYTVETAEASGDTLNCRTLHAVRAFDDPSLCEAAFGAAPCN